MVIRHAWLAAAAMLVPTVLLAAAHPATAQNAKARTILQTDDEERQRLLIERSNDSEERTKRLNDLLRLQRLGDQAQQGAQQPAHGGSQPVLPSTGNGSVVVTQ